MARVQQPAPHWAGTAVIDNDFEEISLDQYKGMCVCMWCAWCTYLLQIIPHLPVQAGILSSSSIQMTCKFHQFMYVVPHRPVSYTGKCIVCCECMNLLKS